MNPKKKKRPSAAQQLIDSLLDERTPMGAPDGPPRASAPAEKPERSLRSVQSTRVQPSALPLETLTVEASPARTKRNLTEELESSLHELTRDVSEAPETSTPTNLSGTKSEPKALGDADNEHAETVRLEVQLPNEIPETEDLDHSTQQVSNPTRGRQKRDQKQDPKNDPKNDEKSEFQSMIDRQANTELRTVVRLQPGERPARAEKAPRNGATAFGMSSSEAHLRQSESLRLAQSRITELEHELERFRRENEQLASAGETLSRRIDELTAKSENLEIQSREAERIRDEERKVFRGQLQHKERENGEMRVRLDEMEGRLENNFKKIRVRERELEHRLEIVRMESATLVSTKDKMILDLKRQIDQLTHESEYSKQKSQELYNQNKDKQETARRVVRALRIALTILEGDENGGNGD